MKSKTILISNSNDYTKFLRKLSIYKSILYYNTIFVVKNDINDNMIDYIINALNIKNRKKRIIYIYDKSCELIDKNTKNLNICGFKNNKCYVQRKLNNGKCNGCCRKCLYQTNKGCPTKNLACKLFNCSEVTSRYDVIKYDDLKLLKLLSLKNQFIIKSDYFSTREDVLKDLYSYTFAYSTLRIVYRLVKNYIHNEKKKNTTKCDYFGSTYKSLLIKLFILFEKIDKLNVTYQDKENKYNKRMKEIIRKQKNSTLVYLKELTNDINKIDNAMYDFFLGYDSLNYNIIKNLYNIYTKDINLVQCESEGKMKFIVPINQKIFDNNYNINKNLKLDFSHLKIIYDYASQNKKLIKHHDFLWHNSIPESLKNEINSIDNLNLSVEEKKELKRSATLKFIDYYAFKLSSFFKDNNYPVILMDALNEISENEHDYLYRESFWKNAIGKNPLNGDEYFIDVLKIIKKYFPKTELIYNEYNECNIKKCNKICKIIQYIKKVEKRDNIKLVDGLGLQSHYLEKISYNRRLSVKDIIKTSKKYKKLNIPLYCTEFDFICNDKREKQIIINSFIKQYKNNLKGFVTWGNNDNLTWHHCIDKNGNYLNAHIIDSNGNYKNEYLHLINIFNQHNKNH